MITHLASEYLVQLKGLFFNLNERLHFIFIITTVIFFAYFLLTKHKTWRLKEIFRLFFGDFPRFKFGLYIFKIQFLIYFVLNLIYVWWTNYFAFKLSHSFDIFPSEKIVLTGIWPEIIIGFIYLLAKDLSFFVPHYLYHHVEMLWPIHKVHHDTDGLFFFDYFREHPLETIINYISDLLFVGVTLFFIFGFFKIAPIKSFAIVAAINILYNSQNMLRHMQACPLRFPGLVSKLFISPVMHHAHHGTDPKHIDINFGRMFSFWDMMSNSLYIPSKDEEIKIGVLDSRSPQTIKDHLYLPFREWALAREKKRNFHSKQDRQDKSIKS